jgi:hypothetical protein
MSQYSIAVMVGSVTQSDEGTSNCVTAFKSIETHRRRCPEFSDRESRHA